MNNITASETIFNVVKFIRWRWSTKQWHFLKHNRIHKNATFPITQLHFKKTQHFPKYNHISKKHNHISQNTTFPQTQLHSTKHDHIPQNTTFYKAQTQKLLCFIKWFISLWNVCILVVFKELWLWYWKCHCVLYIGPPLNLFMIC